MFEHILSLMIFLPILAGLGLLLVPISKEGARAAGLVVSMAVLILGIRLYSGFDGNGGMEFVEKVLYFKSVGINYILGIDGISLFVLMASAVLFPLIFLVFTTKPKGYYANLLIAEGAMAGAVCAGDLILFYIFWEVMLLPIFFMMGIYGGEGKVAATIKITIYTIAGSLLMLAAILYIGVVSHNQFGTWSFEVSRLAGLKLHGTAALLAFCGFMIAFAIKIPIFPFHTWLPDAYTEAPAAATFVLSAIMAKIGVYAVIRFVIPVFGAEFTRYALLLAYLGVIGMIYCGIAAIAQKDFKRMLAFSSASHMGIIAVGVFCMNIQSLTGSIYQIVAHATSTGALFLFAGVLEERCNTRKIEDLGGIATQAPVLALFFAIAMLASVGLPGTSGFIGEFLIILGAVKFNIIVGILAGTGMIIGVCYMLWMFQRVFFEKVKEQSRAFRDLTSGEIVAFIPIVLLILVMGIYPQPFIKKIEPAAKVQIGAVLTSSQVLAVNIARNEQHSEQK